GPGAVLLEESGEVPQSRMTLSRFAGRRPRGPQPHERRAPAAAIAGRLLEALDVRAPRQRAVHARALHASAAPVDHAHLAEAALRGGLEIALDHALDLARQEAVQIERVLDRDHDRIGEGRVVALVRHTSG